MKSKLIAITLTNFKGTRLRTVNFGDLRTNIRARNKLGKTTIFDAFLWLFFGKDSTGRKDFEIKTLDEQNQPYHNLIHEVAATIKVDGDRVTIRRRFTEKWEKKAGDIDKTFKGHTTECFWDDVPLKIGEYEKKIDAILQEEKFRLITSTNYFASLKWEQRRSVLSLLGGQGTDKELLLEMINAGKTEYQPLYDELGSKTVDEYGSVLSSKKGTLKKDLEQYPHRISEATNSLPDAVEYDSVAGLLETAKGMLKNIDAKLMDKTTVQKEHQQKITAKLTEINNLKQQRNQLEYDITNSTKGKKQERESTISDMQAKINSLNSDIARLTTEWTKEDARITGLKAAKELLAENYTKVSAEHLEFKDGEFKCPACGTEFAADIIDQKKKELTANFNKDKADRVQAISDKGNGMKSDIAIGETNLDNIKARGIAARGEMEKLTGDIAVLKEENERLNANEKTEVEEAIKNNTNIIAIDEKLVILNTEINETLDVEDNTELLKDKNDLTEKIATYNRQLSTKEQREKIIARITELQGQETASSAELAKLEGIEFMIGKFTREKMDDLEIRINSKFELVKFKLFEQQINGGWVPCCLTLINGVPFTDANKASQINAGLDIINVLCRHYDVSAPVFVDNAESVNELIHTDSQMIALYATLDNELVVEKIDY